MLHGAMYLLEKILHKLCLNVVYFRRNRVLKYSGAGKSQADSTPCISAAWQNTKIDARCIGSEWPMGF